VVLAVAGPVTIGGALVGTALANRWEAAPAVVGLSVTMLLVGLGVAAVASVVWTHPVPEPGANPFSSTSGGSVAAVLQQGAAALATTLLVSPALAAAVLALWWPAVGLAVLAVGPAWGALCLWAGVRRGGRRLDRHGPELLAALRT
jgi:ABC-2 type transport system permease protein